MNEPIQNSQDHEAEMKVMQLNQEIARLQQVNELTNEQAEENVRTHDPEAWILNLGR